MPLYAHPGGCNQCHTVGDEWTLTAPILELCATADCHPPLVEPPERVHGPAAIVNCTVCHLPHTALHPHLLVRAEPALCDYCHDRLITCPAGKPTHTPRDPACTSCHGAHGGEGWFLLRSDRDE